MELQPVPASLVRSCYKVVFEPPSGVKQALQRSYQSVLEPARTDRAPALRARVHFLAVWLHAVIVERMRYNPIGWSKAYEFNEADLRCCLALIDELLDTERSFLSRRKKKSAFGGRRALEGDRDADQLELPRRQDRQPLRFPHFGLAVQAALPARRPSAVRAESAAARAAGPRRLLIVHRGAARGVAGVPQPAGLHRGPAKIAELRTTDRESAAAEGRERQRGERQLARGHRRAGREVARAHGGAAGPGQR